MPPFELIDARSPKEAVRLLQKYGPRAQLLASGADVFSLLKDRIAGSRLPLPEVLVSLAEIEGLRTIAEDPRHPRSRANSRARAERVGRAPGAGESVVIERAPDTRSLPLHYYRLIEEDSSVLRGG
jgi:hypothetical protein